MTSAFQLASDYVDAACSLDPLLCTQLGVPGSDGLLGIRSDAVRRLGDRFDLREFHATVLNHGTMRLDLLRQLVSTVLG